MKIGVPSEIKAQEYRVGLTPASVQNLTNHGHEVLVQDKAGFGAGFGANPGAGFGASFGVGFGARFGAVFGAGFGAAFCA